MIRYFQGIYSVSPHLLSNSPLTGRIDPGTWGSWSSWTRGRSCQSGSCDGEDVQTTDKACPDSRNNLLEDIIIFSSN